MPSDFFKMLSDHFAQPHRPMTSYSRAQERMRLERDIASIKQKINQKRSPSQNDGHRLADILGKYALPAAYALEKAYFRSPGQLHRELNKDFVAPELPAHRRQGRGDGRGRLAVASRRRALSADPDSPSRRQDLKDQVFVCACVCHYVCKRKTDTKTHTESVCACICAWGCVFFV